MSSARSWQCIEAFVLIFVALMPTVLAIFALEFNFWPEDASIMIGLVLVNVAGASVVLIYLQLRKRRMERSSSDSEYQSQDAEPNDDPPNYDDVITKASVTGKPPTPSLCQGNIDSTLSTTSNFTDSELPSYNEALNRSFETKILLEDSSYASVHK